MVAEPRARKGLLAGITEIVSGAMSGGNVFGVTAPRWGRRSGGSAGHYVWARRPVAFPGSEGGPIVTIDINNPRHE